MAYKNSCSNTATAETNEHPHNVTADKSHIHAYISSPERASGGRARTRTGPRSCRFCRRDSTHPPTCARPTCRRGRRRCPAGRVSFGRLHPLQEVVAGRTILLPLLQNMDGIYAVGNLIGVSNQNGEGAAWSGRGGREHFHCWFRSRVSVGEVGPMPIVTYYGLAAEMLYLQYAWRVLHVSASVQFVSV